MDLVDNATRDGIGRRSLLMAASAGFLTLLESKSASAWTHPGTFKGKLYKGKQIYKGQYSTDAPQVTQANMLITKVPMTDSVDWVNIFYAFHYKARSSHSTPANDYIIVTADTHNLRTTGKLDKAGTAFSVRAGYTAKVPSSVGDFRATSAYIGSPSPYFTVTYLDAKTLKVKFSKYDVVGEYVWKLFSDNGNAVLY